MTGDLAGQPVDLATGFDAGAGRRAALLHPSTLVLHGLLVVEAAHRSWPRAGTRSRTSVDPLVGMGDATRVPPHPPGAARSWPKERLDVAAERPGMRVPLGRRWDSAGARGVTPAPGALRGAAGAVTARQGRVEAGRRATGPFAPPGVEWEPGVAWCREPSPRRVSRSRTHSAWRAQSLDGRRAPAT